MASYLYAAYIWKGLANEDCFADINSEQPLPKDASNKGINVSWQFKIAIRWGFWMSLLTFIRAILAQIGLYLKRWVLLWCSYVMFAANISISIVLFFLMQVWRWSHSGRVCSGDLLPADVEPDKSVYLVFEGNFIKAILFAIYSIIGLSLVSIFIVSICVCRRHAREDKEMAESGAAKKPVRQTAFTRALDPDYEHAMRETSSNENSKKIVIPASAEEEN